jgi:dihydrolipoamide dehydrogenase
MPSKALLHASELFELASKDFAGIGIDVAPKLNLQQMLSQKASRSATDKGIEFLFKKNKVDWVKGKGAIAGAGKVEVAGPTAAKTTLSRQEHRHRHRLGADAAAGRRGRPDAIVDSTGRCRSRPCRRSWW